MKKIWIVFLMAFSIAFAGCKQEPLDLRPATVEALVVGDGGNIGPSGVANLKVGDSKFYYISTEANYSIKSVKVKGVEQPVSNTIKVTASTPNEYIKIEVEFISDYVVLITAHPWYFNVQENYCENELESAFTVIGSKIYDQYFFDTNGSSYILLYGNSVRSKGTDWCLKGKFIQFGSVNQEKTLYEIVELNSEVFTYRFSPGTNLSGKIMYISTTFKSTPLK